MLEASSLGQSRGSCVATMLKELNDSVNGLFVEEDPVQLIRENPAYFKDFTIVIATQARFSSEDRARSARGERKRGRRSHACPLASPLLTLHVVSGSAQQTLTALRGGSRLPRRRVPLPRRPAARRALLRPRRLCPRQHQGAPAAQHTHTLGSGVVSFAQLPFTHLRFPSPQEHCVIESKPDNTVADLRLLNPWPDLAQYAESLDLAATDDMTHKHVPWVVLLLRALAQWRREHAGATPSTRDEKAEFRKLLESWRRSHDEANFDEAAEIAKYKARAARGRAREETRQAAAAGCAFSPMYTALLGGVVSFAAPESGVSRVCLRSPQLWARPELSADLRAILADPLADPLSSPPSPSPAPPNGGAAGAGAGPGADGAAAAESESAQFWVLVAGLKCFVDGEGGGLLPLEGTLPDMTSLTECASTPEDWRFVAAVMRCSTLEERACSAVVCPPSRACCLCTRPSVHPPRFLRSLYIHLQKLYQAKAAADAAEVERHCRRILRQARRGMHPSLLRPPLRPLRLPQRSAGCSLRSVRVCECAVVPRHTSPLRPLPQLGRSDEWLTSAKVKHFCKNSAHLQARHQTRASLYANAH